MENGTIQVKKCIFLSEKEFESLAQVDRKLYLRMLRNRVEVNYTVTNRISGRQTPWNIVNTWIEDNCNSFVYKQEFSRYLFEDEKELAMFKMSIDGLKL